MLEQHNDEVCEDHREKCPLPRIGSKEWGWHRETSLREYSDYTEYYICTSVVYDVNGRFAASCRENADAKRVAELLARRDWRRENRGKK